MADFTKPKPTKASLKMAMYGPSGSGKTFTALLIAEGLAAGKRVALVDTEQGSLFYAQPVPARKAHPDAFDFEVLHSRSITEVLAALHRLDCSRHGVVVIDSVTHLWDSCKNAYLGRTTRNGVIPMHAWTQIKRPYKELMHWVLSSPVHVILCGRQGVEYGEDESSGELTCLGYKMRAEGETAYEPDLLLRLESRRQPGRSVSVPVAHVEKDRTGVLAGQSIEWPGFESVARPLLGLLGGTPVELPTEEEVSVRDAEALARAESDRRRRSAELASRTIERFGSAASSQELGKLGQELTATVKAQLLPADLERVRQAYGRRHGQLAGNAELPGQ